jgi:hypothetical protein
MDTKLTKPTFSLMSEGEESLKVKITDATLFVRKCKLCPSVALGLAAGLKVEPFKIPINRCEMRSTTIGKGLTTKEIPNHIIG